MRVNVQRAQAYPCLHWLGCVSLHVGYHVLPCAPLIAVINNLFMRIPKKRIGYSTLSGAGTREPYEGAMLRDPIQGFRK